MCVAIISPNRKHRPSQQTLNLCAQHNPHGGGIAWVGRKHKKVHFLKGISAEGIAAQLQGIRGPVVIHFRIASVGPVDRLLCHPFPVSEIPATNCSWSCDEVLFANGTWHGWRDWQLLAGPVLKGPVSDTRVAAAAVWQHGFEWLENSGCKFVLLTTRGYQTIGEFFEQSDGCLYSNLYWKPVASTAHKTISLSRKQSLYDEAMACFGD